MGEKKRETVKERKRERERQGEYENREGKEKSVKTDVPKLYAYNECELSVVLVREEVSHQADLFLEIQN